MKKKVLTVLLAGVMAFSLAGCGGKNDEPAAKEPEQKEEEKEDEKEPEAEADDGADEDKNNETADFENLTVDVGNKEISFEAVVNGTYFTEATRHAVSWEEGGNGDKAILRAKPYNVDFHDALEALGAKGDSNVSMDDMSASVDDGIVNTGTKIEYYVKWEGQDEIPLKDAIKGSEEFDWNLVFAGNRDVAEETQAGCILCLDSCAAGVSVNTLPVGTTGDDGIDFFGNDEVLPEDGTAVTVIVRIAE